MTPDHRRLCVQCHGEGWTTGPEVDGWPTIAPCAECRPVTSALALAGAYLPDAPTHKDSDRWQSLAATADTGRAAKTALWPWPDLLAEWPPPGQRTTTPRTPTPANRPTERHP